MLSWYESLDAIQRIFALIAIPSTAVLVVQTVLLILEIGKSVAASGSVTGDDRFVLFSVRSIVAMLSIGGWSGIALIELNINIMLAGTLAALIGLLTLFGIALLIKVL